MRAPGRTPLDAADQKAMADACKQAEDAIAHDDAMGSP